MKRLLLSLASIGLAAAVVALVVAGGTRLPDGPMPIAWDREACAHCHMQIGEPRHAAQLITTRGEVLSFDDVGCALDYLRQKNPAVHRLWFHGDGDTWLGTDVVGFAPASVTPMGSGLMAVDRRSADATPLEAVLRERATPPSPAPPSGGALP